MKRYMWPLAALVAVVLAGVAVLIAPFALRLNPGGAWSAATSTMFWSGLGIIVVGLAALAAWQRELAQTVAAAFPDAAEDQASTSVNAAGAEEAPSPEAQWEAELARLTEAVIADLRAAVPGPQTVPALAQAPGAAPAAGPAADDLLAVVSQVQRDLAKRRTNRVSAGGGPGGGA